MRGNRWRKVPRSQADPYFHQMIDGLLAAPSTCAICDSNKVRYRAYYIPAPDFAKLIGQPHGKLRRVVYSLCARCKKKENVAHLVETKILRELGPPQQ